MPAPSPLLPDARKLCIGQHGRRMEQHRTACFTLFQTPAGQLRRQAFTTRSAKPSTARMALRVSTTSGQWAARL